MRNNNLSENMNWKDNFPNEYRYFETNNGILYCGNCIDILQSFPSESIDLLLTDPPYKISMDGNKITRTYKHYKWKRNSDIQLDYGEWDRQWTNDKEYFSWVEQWFAESVRILKEKSWIYIFFDKLKIGIFDLYLAPKYNIKSRTIYVWVKSNPVISFRKVSWNSGTEFIWVGSKGEGKLKNFLEQKYMANYFIYPNASVYKKTKHPTEKPEKLLERLVLVNTNENEIILDPFFGSGTLGVVAERLGRRWIGIELNEEYCEMAKNRIKIEISEQRLF